MVVGKSTELFRRLQVGAGLAALAGAAFLIRDGQMPGNRITILEQHQLPGGALDGIKEPNKGFVIRGGREMEEHFECLWDLYRSIPSLAPSNQWCSHPALRVRLCESRRRRCLACR